LSCMADLSYIINRIRRKYDFKFGKYTIYLMVPGPVDMVGG